MTPKEKAEILDQLDQVAYEVRGAVALKNWELLSELGAELKIRGEVIRLFGEVKQKTDTLRDN